MSPPTRIQIPFGNPATPLNLDYSNDGNPIICIRDTNGTPILMLGVVGTGYRIDTGKGVEIHEGSI